MIIYNETLVYQYSQCEESFQSINITLTNLQDCLIWFKGELYWWAVWVVWGLPAPLRTKRFVYQGRAIPGVVQGRPPPPHLEVRHRARHEAKSGLQTSKPRLPHNIRCLVPFTALPTPLPPPHHHNQCHHHNTAQASHNDTTPIRVLYKNKATNVSATHHN